MRGIIRFREENIDGCGTDVELMVRVTNMEVTNDHYDKLRNAIADIREEWEPEDQDTDSIVEEALDRVFGKDAAIEYIVPEYNVIF